MSRVSEYVLIFFSLALVPSVTMGQQGAVVLQLETNVPDARVYADHNLLGTASERYFNIGKGEHEIRLVANDQFSWSIPPVVTRIDSGLAGDTIAVHLDFPYYYRLESTPYNAEVELRDGLVVRPLGLTPSTVESATPLTGVLDFNLAGFKTESVVPGAELWNLYVIRLEPLEETGDVSRFALSPPSSRRRWIDYASIGTALVAGAVAVHFKFKADRRYDRYVETGDPTLRPTVKRYDTYSGVALGVMQAGAGLFAVRLILR